MENDSKIPKPKAIVIRLDALEQFSMLSDREAGVLIKSLLRYAKTGEAVTIKSRVIMMAFNNMKAVIDDYARNYEAKCARNKAAIEERWRRKREEEAKNGQNDDTNVYERIQPNTDEDGCIQNKYNKSETINKSKTSLRDVSVYARTHEETESFFESLSKDQSFIEYCCMTFHVQSNRVLALLAAFDIECKAKSKPHFSEGDFRSHFVSWAKIEIEKGSKSKSDKNNDGDVNSYWENFGNGH